MKKINFISSIVLAATLVFTACQEKETFPKGEEGRPVTLSLQIATPAPSQIQITKASDAQETAINKLALLFYKDENSTPIVVEPAIGEPEKVSETNYLYTVENIQADGLVTGEWYLYAIANYTNPEFGTVNLDDVKTKKFSELENYLVTKNNSSIDLHENYLLLTGRYGTGDGKVELKFSNDNTDEIELIDRVHLRRFTSKIKFNFATESGISFEPTSYSIFNLPLQAPLFEKSDWTDENVNSASSASVSKTFAAPVTVASTSKEIEFYMLENAQAKVDECVNYTDREKHVSPADQAFLNAPDHATYLVVEGDYRDATYVGKVKYTIHLGDFRSSKGSNGNFSVRRNAKYNYKVTIAGVSKIVAEAEYTGGEYQELQPGAEGVLTDSSVGQSFTVDAHYEQVMLSFNIKDETGTPRAIDSYMVEVSTPFVNKKVEVTADAATRDLSSIAADINWVKFAKPAGPTEFILYPGAGKVATLQALIADFNDKVVTGAASNYFFVADDRAYTIAFIDEYYYNGEDVKKFVNAQDRTLAFGKGLTSKDKQSIVYSNGFTIHQRSIKTPYDLNSPGVVAFGIESMEEDLGKHYDYRQVGGSQDDNDGWKNYTNDKNGIKIGNKWDAFVVPANFGHLEDKALIGTVKPNADNRQLNGGVMKPEADLRSYCISRNRDENGNGKIDENEVKWYIPAANQFKAIFVGRSVLGAAYPSTFVQTIDGRASDGRLLKAVEGAHLGYSYISSTSDQRLVVLPEFATMPESAFQYWFDYGMSVRCVRTLAGDHKIQTSTIADAQGQIVSVNHISSDALRQSGTVVGEYGAHMYNESTNIVPQSFEVAANELSYVDSEGNTKNTFVFGEIWAGTLCQDHYSQNPDGSDLGSWRVPNQQELMVMGMVRSTLFPSIPDPFYDKVGNNHTHPVQYASKTVFHGVEYIWYNNTPQGSKSYDNVYALDLGGGNTSASISDHPHDGYGFEDGNAARTHDFPFHIRCVRDAQPAAAAAARSVGAGVYANGGNGI